MTLIAIDKKEYEVLLEKIERVCSAVESLQAERDIKLYDVSQTAKEMGITRQTLNKHIKCGIITDYTLFGNKIYFTRSQITKNYDTRSYKRLSGIAK